jgi:hypothetical protein
MRKIIATLLVGAAVSGGLIACGGDDDNTVVTMNDAGQMITIMPDGNMITTQPDGQVLPPPGNDGSTGDGSTGDAGSGCAFTDFVNNEVTNGTNGTSPPQSVSGITDPSCSYTGTPFAGLFK